MKSLVYMQEDIISMSDSLRRYEQYVESRPALKKAWSGLIRDKRQRLQAKENRYNILKYCL